MIFLSFKFCVWILSGQWCSMIQWNVSRMPKHRAPAPPGDQIPDTQAPPPPLPLNSRHSSSSQSLRSNTSSTSEMGHNSFDRRQDPKRLPYFFSNFTSQDEVFIYFYGTWCNCMIRIWLILMFCWNMLYHETWKWISLVQIYNARTIYNYTILRLIW